MIYNNSGSPAGASVGSGLALSGGTLGLSKAGCVTGDVLKSAPAHLGGGWLCVADNDTQLTAQQVATHASDEGFVRGVDLAAIASSGSWNHLNGIPADLADGDANTQRAAGSGLALNGNRLSIAANGVGNSELAASAVTNTEIADDAAISMSKIDTGLVVHVPSTNNQATNGALLYAAIQAHSAQNPNTATTIQLGIGTYDISGVNNGNGVSMPWYLTIRGANKFGTQIRVKGMGTGPHETCNQNCGGLTMTSLSVLETLTVYPNGAGTMVYVAPSHFGTLYGPADYGAPEVRNVRFKTGNEGASANTANIALRLRSTTIVDGCVFELDNNYNWTGIHMMHPSNSNNTQNHLVISNSHFKIGSNNNQYRFAAIWAGNQTGDWLAAGAANTYLGRTHVRLTNVSIHTFSHTNGSGVGVFAYGSKTRVRIANSHITARRTGLALKTGHHNDGAAAHGKIWVYNSVVDAGTYNSTVRTSGVDANDNVSCSQSTTLEGLDLTAACGLPGAQGQQGDPGQPGGLPADQR